MPVLRLDVRRAVVPVSELNNEKRWLETEKCGLHQNLILRLANVLL